MTIRQMSNEDYNTGIVYSAHTHMHTESIKTVRILFYLTHYFISFRLDVKKIIAHYLMFKVHC
jgi:hypothetical protein